MAYEQGSSEILHCFLVKLNWLYGFCGELWIDELREKALTTEIRANLIHIWSHIQECKPGLQQWEVSILTTIPLILIHCAHSIKLLV